MASRLALGRSRCRVLPSAVASSSLFASTRSPSLQLARPYSQLPHIPGGPALTEEQIAAHKAAERESSRKAMEFMEEQYQLELANARRKADQRPNSRLPQQQVSLEDDTISDAEYRKTAAAPAAVAAVGSNPMAAAPVSPPPDATPAVPAAASTRAPPAEPVVTPAVMKGHSMATAIPAGNATPPATAPKPVVEQVVPPTPQSPPPPHGPAFPRTRFAFKTAVVLALSGLGYTYYSDSSAAAHHLVVMPLIRAFVDAEDSHRLAINVLQWPVRPVDKGVDDPVLETDVRHGSVSPEKVLRLTCIVFLLHSVLRTQDVESFGTGGRIRQERGVHRRCVALLSNTLAASETDGLASSQVSLTSDLATSRLAV